MGRNKSILPGLLTVLALAGCAHQGMSPVAVPQARPSVSEPSIGADPNMVASVTSSLASLDRQAYRAVSVAQSGGTVLLTGAVARPDQRRLVEQRVAAVPGVTSVANRLLIADDAALDGYFPDMAKEQELSSQTAPNLALRVVHGVIYLVGDADPQDVERLKEIVADDAAIQWVDATAVTYR